MDAWLKRLEELESEIFYKLPPADGQVAFRYTTGRLPILLSAPHGAAHMRNGRLKEEDDYTAGLVRLVAELTGAHALFAWCKSDSDPNYDPESPYKKALGRIIRRYGIGFVLDIHGCAAYREFGLGLGTMGGQSCPQQRRLILQTLYRQGFRESGPWLSRLDLDQTFTAAGGTRQETITRYCWQKMRIPAAQLEFNAYLRVVRRLPEATEREPFKGEPEQIQKAVRTLLALVRTLAKTEL
jgi:hypothetical protein